MTILGLDHVQLAAPPGAEEELRRFYGDLLGLEELEKPEALRSRGGCWFAAGLQQLHVGIEPAFVPARKAHPGLVASDLEALRVRLREHRVPFEDDASIAAVDRIFLHDPFGNRLEVRAG